MLDKNILLHRINNEFRRLAGLPTISGGSVAPAEEWTLAEIYGVVSNWSPGLTDVVEVDSSVGDGESDATSAIQEAINNTPENGIIVFPPNRTYQVTSTITIPRPMTLMMHGATFYQNFEDAPGSTQGVFFATGSQGSLVSLTSDAPMNSFEVDLPTGQGANFEAGDWIAFRSELIVSTWKAREVKQIISVDGDTVKLAEPLSWDYNVADTARFQKVNPIDGLRFIGGKFTNQGNNKKAYAIRVNYSVNTFFEGCQVEQGGGGFYLFECQNFQANNISVRRLFSYADSFGYGFTLSDACSNGVVNNMLAMDTRHGFTVLNASSNYGASRNIVLNNCIGTGTDDCVAVWDTHADGWNIIFNNCVAQGGIGGFNVRSTNTTLNNCKAYNASTRGVTIAHSARNCKVQGGEFAYNALQGINIDDTAGAGPDHVVIEGAQVHDNGSRGIDINIGATNPTVKNCEIYDNEVDGIRDQGSVGAVFDNNRIPFSTGVQTAAIRGIQADAIVRFNIVQGYSGQDAFPTPGEGATIQDNVGYS